jgi:N-acyl amino acid synthase of PEP-CTERM/exosortase system
MIAMRDLAEIYQQHFDVVRARTPAQLDQAFHLRYQVYCVEHQFLDPTKNPGSREIDEHDENSVHILLVHRRTNKAFGTARVIIPHLGSSWQLLPIHDLLPPIYREEFDRYSFHQIGEISRFAVSKEFRHQWAEMVRPGFNCDRIDEVVEQQLLRHLIFGLLGEVVEICLEYGVVHLAAVVEPPLFRMLRKFGIEFEPLGGLVEYHGKRQPCVVDIGRFIESSRYQNTDLWQFMSLRNPVSFWQHEYGHHVSSDIAEFA